MEELTWKNYDERVHLYKLDSAGAFALKIMKQNHRWSVIALHDLYGWSKIGIRSWYMENLHGLI